MTGSAKKEVTCSINIKKKYVSFLKLCTKKIETGLFELLGVH